MKPLTRIRIILFALMIFGAFANFALNEWGNTLIVWCEVIMALSFLGEICFTLFHRIKTNNRRKLSVFMLSLVGIMVLSLIIIMVSVFFAKRVSEIFPVILLSAFLGLTLIIVIEAVYDFVKKTETLFLYENVFLFVFFMGLVFKNASFPGTGPMLVFSILFLVPYFVTSTIKFFKANYKSGKGLVIVLTFGSFATILLGIAFMMKTMHWPFSTVAFYLAVAITMVMIIGAMKWNYEYKGTRINILEGLRLFKTNIILLFFMLFVFTSYKYLTYMEIAPDFYSADYPETFYKLRNGKADEWQKVEELKEAYDNFVQNAEKNGFIK